MNSAQKPFTPNFPGTLAKKMPRFRLSFRTFLPFLSGRESPFSKINFRNRDLMKPALPYDPRFVENHLIAYIGNKRRLLPLLLKALAEVESRGSRKISKDGVFIDFFSGTGVVARLAKSLGFSVIANDWEDYSRVLNRAFIEGSDEDVRLFENEGGLDRVLAELNALAAFDPEAAYISEYYCPADDARPDVEKERLFYTRQNGILIDNIRLAIEKRYAGSDRVSKRKKNLLLALLLVEASTRANTNGVFKGFHQGFGGLSHDALSRILRPVSLSAPVLLPDTKKRHKVFKSDALKLAKKLSGLEAEIAYLDPPYNQHQYGSNYHLLNTVARNDRPPVSKSFWIDGKKTDKSAIRKDWIKTRSAFCYKESAHRDFKTLVQTVRAKYILVSYSTEGIISVEDMVKILAEKGRVGVVTSGYVRYRGGRQSITTKNKNIEFVLLVDTNAVSTEKDVENIRSVLLESDFQNLMEESFPIPVSERGAMKKEDGLCLRVVDESEGIPLIFRLPLDARLHIRPGFHSIFEPLPGAWQKRIVRAIKGELPATHAEEIEKVLELLENDLPVDRAHLLRRVRRLYKKINPRKNREAFEEVSARVSEFAHAHPEESAELLRDYKTVRSLKKNLEPKEKVA